MEPNVETTGGDAPDASNAMAQRLQLIRMASVKAAATIGEKAKEAAVATGTAISSVAAATGQSINNATQAVRQHDWTREEEALNKVKQQAIGAANTVAKGGAAVIQNVQARTSEGIKKVFGGPLSHIAKNESNARPCPRLALCCCTGIVTGGLAEPGIFRSPADPEELYCLYGAFENANGLVLPPPGTSPHVLAHVMKKFLITLPEPLLTFKLLPEFLAAADKPHDALAVMPKLPQVNFNTLLLLLETLSRVVEFADHNGMQAIDLARELAPCLAWHPVADARSPGWGWGGAASTPNSVEEGGHMDSEGYLISARTELPAEELDKVVAVLAYLIGDFRMWIEGVVFT